ncbi:MAG: helicase-related protein [Nanoarchaeota archaeon]
MDSIIIPSQTKDPTVDLALDTIQKKKQALIFVNTKRSAEKVAEDIARKTKLSHPYLNEIAYKARKALSKPTKQCERLAYCLERGTAFHHAGLAQKQRELIEDSFREKKIPIIACTPTLAAGVDLPAFRTILRDLRRYGHHGLTWIPVLEYLQQAGRAGRPSFDSYGEAIAIASTDAENEKIIDQYIHGEPESIQSKLAVEPVLRTYILSLISAEFITTRTMLVDFFSKTFWAKQFGDMELLEGKLDSMIAQLQKWKFLKGAKEDLFVDADKLLTEELEATPLGRRVAELYLDPFTARYLLDCLDRMDRKKVRAFSFLHIIARTLEMRPQLRVRKKDDELISDAMAKYHDSLLENEPYFYDPEFEEFQNAIKTALFMQDWIDEKDEEHLLEAYDIRPGEIRGKLDIGDWLLFAMDELAKILKMKEAIPEIRKTRMRLKYGAKEELFGLLRFKDIGRIRARKLFKNNIKDIQSVKHASPATLSQILGPKVAQSIKQQVGEQVVKVKKGARKGQLSLGKY